MDKCIALLVFCCLNICGYSQPQSKGAHSVALDSAIVKGNTYALIVGISNYKYWRDLDFADDDALAFEAFLRSPAGGSVDSNNIRVLLDSNATAENIGLLGLKWLSKNVKANDQVYIYFSGHGDALSTSESYLLAHDAPDIEDPNSYNYTGGTIQVYNLKKRIAELVNKGVQVMLVTDACRTNELPGGAEGQSFAFKSIMETQAGEVMFASCAANQVSYEDTIWGSGRGVFSYYLLNGWYGLADSDNDQKVSLYELKTYVEENVRTATRPLGAKPQTPVVCCPDKYDLTLARVDLKLKKEMLARMSKKPVNKSNRTEFAAKGIVRRCQECDSLTQEYYDKFSNALKAGNLTKPSKKSALKWQQELAKVPGAESIYSDATEELRAELSNKAQLAINDFFNEKDSFLTRERFQQGAEYMGIVLSLIDSSDEMYANYRSRKLFLEGLSMRFDKDQYKLALAKLDSALMLEPKLSHCLQAKGQIYYKFNNTEDAIKSFEKANQFASKWTEPLRMLGNTYKGQKDYIHAVEYYEKALALDSTNVNLHNQAAESYIELKQNDKAIKHYKAAIRHRQSDLRAYVALGKIYLEQGNSLASLSYLKAGHIKDSSNLEIMKGMAEVYIHMKDFGQAEYYAQKYLSITPVDKDMLLMLAELHINSGNTDAAVEPLKKLIRLYPNAVKVHYMHALFFAVSGNNSKSVSFLRSAHALGWRNFNKVEADPRFDGVRASEAYKIFRTQVSGAGQED